MKQRYLLAILSVPITLFSALDGSGQTIPANTSFATPLSLLQGALKAAGAQNSSAVLPTYQADGTQEIPGNSSSATHLNFSTTGTALTFDSGAKQRTLTYTDYSGIFTDSLHSSVKISARTAQLSKLLYLPLFEAAGIVQDSQSTFTDISSEQLDGQTALAFTVGGHWFDPSASSTDAPLTVKIYIDPSTLAIIQRSDQIYDSKHNLYTRSFRYSDFRQSGSFSLPYTVTELMNNQVVSITRWTTIAATY